MEPLVPAREEGAGPDSLDGSAGGDFGSQELCSETEAENGRVSNQPEPLGATRSGKTLLKEGNPSPS